MYSCMLGIIYKGWQESGFHSNYIYQLNSMQGRSLITQAIMLPFLSKNGDIQIPNSKPLVCSIIFLPKGGGGTGETLMPRDPSLLCEGVGLGLLYCSTSL